MSRKQSTLEIMAVCLTALLKIIFVNFLELKLVFIVGVSVFWIGYIIYSYKKQNDIFKLWGFTKVNAKTLGTKLAPPATIVAIMFILIGYYNGVNLLNWHIIPVLLLYPIWGLLQQFLVLSLVAGNLSDQNYLNKFWIVLLTAILFGLIHYPDPLLIMATTLLAIIYTLLFLKWRNLWILGLLHGWLGGLFYFYVLNRDPWVEVFGSGLMH